MSEGRDDSADLVKAALEYKLHAKGRMEKKAEIRVLRKRLAELEGSLPEREEDDEALLKARENLLFVALTIRGEALP